MIELNYFTVAGIALVGTFLCQLWRESSDFCFWLALKSTISTLLFHAGMWVLGYPVWCGLVALFRGLNSY